MSFLAVERFNLSWEELRQLSLNSLEHAFLNDEERQDLLAQFKSDCDVFEDMLSADDWQSRLKHAEVVTYDYGKKRLGLENGAVASSVGHDAHNLIIAGTNEPDMQVALERLQAMQGGVLVVREGRVLAEVSLPIAGLMSDMRAPEVAEAITRVKSAWNEVGCTLPYMGFNLLPLSVIPEIRLTDKGLVRVPEMTVQPLFS